MQKCAIKLTNHQLKLAADTDYPITKNQVIANISLLFDELGKHLQQTHFEGSFQFLNHGSYKVTRGENYQGLPYIVLDYPKISGTDFPIVMRTMFWWGKYFSFNIIIQDESLLNKIKPANWLDKNRELFALTSTDKWDNDVLSNAYEPFTLHRNLSYNHIAGCTRLSAILPISQYEELLDYAEFYSLLTTPR
jgi:hypothetical protein